MKRPKFSPTANGTKISSHAPDLFSPQSDRAENIANLMENESRPIGSTTGRQSGSEPVQTNRLFVPLASAPFEWFCSGKKTWELRRHGRQYTERHVWSGRLVELRNGYHSDQAIWGRIGVVLRSENFHQFFSAVPFERVIPTASDATHAETIAATIVKPDPEKGLLGFEVDVISGQTIPLADSLVASVRSGKKTSTIRRGARKYTVGPATFVSGPTDIPIVINSVRIKSVSSLTIEEAKGEGYESLDELLDVLRKFYPTLSSEDQVTIIEFALV